jgi:hypothetical protein
VFEGLSAFLSSFIEPTHGIRSFDRSFMFAIAPDGSPLVVNVLFSCL